MNFTCQKRANRKVKHKAHVNKIITFNRTRTICHFQKYEVMTMSSMWSAKKHENTIYKATKHIKHTFFIPDYY